MSELTRMRRFVSPTPEEDWPALAQRALPDEPVAEAIEKLRSWNLHLFLRNPPGVLLGSDVVFVEAPR